MASDGLPVSHRVRADTTDEVCDLAVPTDAVQLRWQLLQRPSQRMAMRERDEQMPHLRRHRLQMVCQTLARLLRPFSIQNRDLCDQLVDAGHLGVRRFPLRLVEWSQRGRWCRRCRRGCGFVPCCTGIGVGKRCEWYGSRRNVCWVLEHRCQICDGVQETPGLVRLVLRRDGAAHVPDRFEHDNGQSALSALDRALFVLVERLTHAIDLVSNGLRVHLRAFCARFCKLFCEHWLLQTNRCGHGRASLG